MSETNQSTSTAERQGDRRKNPTPFLSKYTFIGKRRASRRGDEKYNYYVDRLDKKAWIATVIIVFLSVTDSIFTIYFLSRGFREINPLMNIAILTGKPAFIILKYLFTITGILVLGLHKNFRFVKELIGFIIALYLFLNIYHLWLFFR
jgi:hypothetical protein